MFEKLINLTVGVTGVPHGVPHHLAGPGLRLDELQLDSGLCNGPEGSGLPVGLRVLLPHDGVELVVVLQFIVNCLTGSNNWAPWSIGIRRTGQSFVLYEHKRQVSAYAILAKCCQ